MPLGGDPVKTLVVSLIIWTFIIPSVMAMFLIVKFLGVFMPSFYLVLIGLVVAVVTLAIMRGLLWIPPSSREDSRVALSKS